MGISNLLKWGWVLQDKPEALERFWEFVHPDAVGIFDTPSLNQCQPIERVQDVLSQLRQHNVRYRFEPAVVGRTSDGVGQLLRDPSMVALSKEATCVDFSGVLAGCLIKAGIRCWVVFATETKKAAGHTFVVADVGTDYTYVGNVGLSGQQAEGQALESVGISWDTLSALISYTPDQYVVLDAARLLDGYSDPGDAHRKDLWGETNRDRGFLGRFDEFVVCDLACWDESQARERPGEQKLLLLKEFQKPLNADLGGSRSGPPQPSISQLVVADHRVVPFQQSESYSGLVTSLKQWMTDDLGQNSNLRGLRQLRWVLMTGRGGVGKSRSGIELLEELKLSSETGPGSGTVGELKLGEVTPDQLSQLALRPGFVGALVDYGEGISADLIENLSEAFLDRPTNWGPVVVVVTARSADEWVDLWEDHLGRPFTLELSPESRRSSSHDSNDTGTDTSRDLFESAITAFAGLMDMAQPDICEIPDLASFSALEILLNAALVVLGEEPQTRDKLYGAVIRHEHTYLAKAIGIKTADTARWVRDNRDDLDEIFAIVSLCRPKRTQLASLSEGDATRRVLRTVFVSDNDPRLLPVRPDPVADHLIKSVLSKPSEPAIERILEVLIAAPGPTIGEFTVDLAVLNELLGTADRAWGPGNTPILLVQTIADTLTRTEIDSSAIGVIFIGHSTKDRHSLARQILEHMLAQDRACEMAANWILDNLDERTPPELIISACNVGLRDIDISRPNKAAILAVKANALWDTHQSRASINKGNHAIDLNRRLVEVDDRYRCDLARALNLQAIRLAGFEGRFGEAVELGGEAVEIWRGLVEIDDRYRNDLAIALNHQSVRLGLVEGRFDEAVKLVVEAVELGGEAVEIWRDLLEIDDRYRNHVALALNYQADRLTHVAGRESEEQNLRAAAAEIRQSLERS